MLPVANPGRCLGGDARASHGPHLAVAPSTIYTPVGHTFPAPRVAFAISLGTPNEAVGGQEACPGVLVLPGAKDCVRAPAAGERRQDMLVSPSVSPRWMCTLALGLLCTSIGHISTLIADGQCWICTDPAIAVNVPEDTSSMNTPSSRDGGCVSAGRLFPAPRPVRSMQLSPESTSLKPAGNARSIRAPNFFLAVTHIHLGFLCVIMLCLLCRSLLSIILLGSCRFCIVPISPLL